MTAGSFSYALKLVFAAIVAWVQAYSLAHAIGHDHDLPNHEHHLQLNHHHHHHADDSCDGDENDTNSETIGCDCLLFAAQNLAIVPTIDKSNLPEHRAGSCRAELFTAAIRSWPPERGPPPRGPPSQSEIDL